MLSITNLIISSLFSCPTVEPMKNFNTTEYIRSTWYIQQQQITGYQPINALYCVSQTLNESKKKVPLYNGDVIDVYNYGRLNGVNGTLENANNYTLCVREPNPSDPGRFLNGPCFIPNLFAGPYWVIAAGPKSNNYTWAIVSGGPPNVVYSDGNCSTKLYGVNGSGLWLFTRHQYGDLVNSAVEYMRGYLLNLGYTLSNLLNVTQKGCSYKTAYIKK